MLCLKPFDFNGFSLKLTKYLMFSDSHFYVKKGLVYENRPYFHNSGPNWSKPGSFVDNHHTCVLHVIDLIFA